MKIFIKVWPDSTCCLKSEFTENNVKTLLKHTKVKTIHSFDQGDAISMIMLKAADKLLGSLVKYGIDARIGLIQNYSRNYPGWTLIVKTDDAESNINPMVARFFSWDRFESRSIIPFEDFMAV